MRKVIAYCLLAACPTYAMAGPIPEPSLSAMRNCMWSETVNKAHEISRRMSLGMNVAVDLALRCGEPLGAATLCQDAGGSPDACMTAMVEEGDRAILNEYKRYSDQKD